MNQVRNIGTLLEMEEPGTLTSFALDHTPLYTQVFGQCVCDRA